MLSCSTGTYINLDIMSRKLPWIEVKPVIWDLDLISINNLLLENAVSVTETITPGGIVEGRQAVEKACCKTAQATVAQCSIMFLLNDVLDSET
jgi:hypothetical protein